MRRLGIGGYQQLCREYGYLISHAEKYAYLVVSGAIKKGERI